MANILIRLKDGTQRRFMHEGRTGGSYTKTVRYESEWVIVTDEDGRETAFPRDLVLEVRSEPHRIGW